MPHPQEQDYYKAAEILGATSPLLRRREKHIGEYGRYRASSTSRTGALFRASLPVIPMPTSYVTHEQTQLGIIRARLAESTLNKPQRPQRFGFTHRHINHAVTWEDASPPCGNKICQL